MCYHQARSARFIGHCWGRGWRDATENLLQTSIINRLGSLPVRRICGTEKSTTFYSSVRVVSGGGQWCMGEGWRSKKTNKQNTGSKSQQQSNNESRESWQALFFFVLKTRANPKKKKRKRAWPLMNKPTLLYKRSPREALIRESRCATFISSMINN